MEAAERPGPVPCQRYPLAPRGHGKSGRWAEGVHRPPRSTAAAAPSRIRWGKRRGDTSGRPGRHAEPARESEDLSVGEGDDPQDNRRRRRGLAAPSERRRARAGRQFQQHLFSRGDGLGRRGRLHRTSQPRHAATPGSHHAKRQRILCHPGVPRRRNGQGAGPSGREAPGDLSVRHSGTRRRKLETDRPENRNARTGELSYAAAGDGTNHPRQDQGGLFRSAARHGALQGSRDGDPPN